MKISIDVTINPIGKPDVYKSLDRVEEFICRLLSSETARDLAHECQIEVPIYVPSDSPKLHRALGFSHTSEKTHSFSCWEREKGSNARKIREFECLAGKNGAAEYNGDIARKWKQSGGKTAEENAGIHLLYRDGQLVKTLWIESDLRSG